MPTMKCPKCGTVVRFEGIAGLCPNCATVVRTASNKPAAPATKTTRQVPTETSRLRGRKGAPDLAAFGGGDDEQFAPGENRIVEPPDPTLRYVIMGTCAVFVLFGIYVVLQTIVTHFASSSGTSPPPPPAPLHSNANPPPEPDEPPVAPAAVPVPMPVTSLAPVTRPAASQPIWASFKAVVPNLAAPPITDKSVGASIKAGVDYLKKQFANGQLINPSDADLFAGQDAICVYSLLNAGKAIDDSDLSPTNSFMRELLDHLHLYSMNAGLSTYDRSLRISAYSMFDRDVDRDQLNRDRDYLLKSASNGGYDYSAPRPGADPNNARFDNSNSQYGVLGIWAATQVGSAVPDKFWVDVEQHWLSCQIPDGSWGYQTDGPQLTMTCAGVTSLCITAEQLELIASKGKKDARPKMAQAIQRGLDWMSKDNNVTQLGTSRGYCLYGVERAALATGFRWFGDHDWYRELGATEIKRQAADGSWDGFDTANVETAFRLLFLSRGRQPLFMDKLRFDGDWNDRPRDVAKLAQFASAQLEKPFAWGVADLKRDWQDWLESPVLMITTDSYPKFSDEECKKLRSYTDAGGLIFIHNEYGSKEVDSFVANLVDRAYPDCTMAKASPTDPIYSAVFPVKTKPVLGILGNGIRPFLIYSPKDLTQDWVRFKPKDSSRNINLQMGLNLFVTGGGKSDFRNRLDSPYETPPDFPAIGTVPVLQVSYHGNWNPEPKALEFFSRWFQKQTSLGLNVIATDLGSLAAAQAPVAVMTGFGPADFSKVDLKALHEYVRRGGVLLIDSAGGDKKFADSVRDALLPAAFPEINPSALPDTHPVLFRGGACMDVLSKPRLRKFASLTLNGVAPDIQYAQLGKGAIFFSELDLTEGLLNASTYAINGYTPDYSRSLTKNVILWAMNRSVQ